MKSIVIGLLGVCCAIAALVAQGKINLETIAHA